MPFRRKLERVTVELCRSRVVGDHVYINSLCAWRQIGGREMNCAVISAQFQSVAVGKVEMDCDVVSDLFIGRVSIACLVARAQVNFDESPFLHH